MIGKVYLERGRPVTVLTRWNGPKAVRNVLIRREDGSEVVRPFRGLRVPRHNEPTEALVLRLAFYRMVKEAAYLFRLGLDEQPFLPGARRLPPRPASESAQLPLL